MVYIEQQPHPALAPYIQLFWYARNPLATHGLERVLPAARMQVVISLARDYLTDCSAYLRDTGAVASTRHSPAALITGMRSRFDLIDRFDMEELIGVIFRPGGTVAFFHTNTDIFTDAETAFEDVWGRRASTLRERMREAGDVGSKFDLLENEFLRRLSGRQPEIQPAAVSLALSALQGGQVTIQEISRQTGLSARRLSEVFREQIGVSPKLYQRILRFQRAVQQMHLGTDVRWMELALECGYYDQSHFVNDFREFSGINPTTYSATLRMWSNHLPIE
jgi:AraC-like DNA-binding protein